VTTLNKHLFDKDPTATKIPNDGVAKVVRPETDAQWGVLDWELKSFVCEGEYERGLERILDSFLTNLGQSQQPAVWVSGFYGSGKSHLCRVLEHLWRDVKLPSGKTARQLVHLPSDIEAHLTELSIAGRRLGGLWSAAGTLGAGKSQAVRLAFLSVLFDSAGLPEQYPIARFALWAREQGYLDTVAAAVTAAGKDLHRELANLYVSPIVAEALLEVDPTLGSSTKDVRDLLRDQFPPQHADITDEEMFDTVEDVLRLRSDTEGRYPLTLVVLDEMQQYLGEDNARTLAVQNIVEGVSSRFDNSVLFVATGQSAMGGTPTLQKLTDRFPVQIQLSDKDVETVVRQVILRKRPDRVPELQGTLDAASGEIDRHLGGTKIAPVAADKHDLVADYPLLPTRRRFWELALRALDQAGKAGVLRTQLRIIHEAAREVGREPVGHVVGADFLYSQQAPALQQSGVLLKEIHELILSLRDEGDDGVLKSRICALAFLISHAPKQAVGTGEIGLRATAQFIADLLVEDLQTDGTMLRKRVPELLEDLVSAGRLMQLGDEYRLQTEEGADWEKDYRSRLAAIRDEQSRLATLRDERLRAAVESAIGNLSLAQGKSKTPRRIELHWGTDEPVGDEARVPVWIRDEWSVSGSAVRNAAAQAGDDSATVHVLLPKRNAESLKDALASHAAAQDTVHAKPTPQTDEGKEAQRSMRGRVEAEDERIAKLLDEVVVHARVLQGGGNEVDGPTLRDRVQTAAERSLVRLYPKFTAADDPNWGRVVTQARDGAPDALSALSYTREVATHPVCREVLAAISASGTKGADLYKRYSDPPYGWPKDAINGAIMTLVATKHILALQDAKPLATAKQLEPRKISTTNFRKEDPPPTMQQQLAVRSLLTKAKIAYDNGQEHAQLSALLQKLRDLAEQAGGQRPLPESPDTSLIDELSGLVGNEQFRAIADAHGQLKVDLETWTAAARRREERQRQWDTLESLLHHARDLEGVAELASQRDGISQGRLLLDNPDPIRPVLDAVTDLLAEHVTAAAEQLRAHHDQVISQLEASDEWQQLDDIAWAEVIDQVGLQRPAEIDVSNREKLLAVLNDAPLSSWKDRTEVIQARAKRAREAAAKRLEPTAVRISLEGATLKAEHDVDAYLATLRERILDELHNGHSVII
jgi:hypothetical protein